MTRQIQVAVAYAFSLFTTYLLLKPKATTPEGTPFGDFRGYYAQDQLAYASIASTAASGNFAPVEPFTETGVSFYPSWWYLAIGGISKVSNVGVPGIWTILGWLAIAGTVIVVGFFAYRLSGKTWAPALVGPSLWIGPLALAVGKQWYLPLDSHAVLWGPYGALFTLNAEAVGICLGAIAMILLLLAVIRGAESRKQFVLVAVAGFLIGLLANIHTYAFLVTIGFLATWVAIMGLGLATSRRLPLIGLSVALFTGVAVLASTLLQGSLAVFALILVATVPGAYVVARRVPWLVLTGLAAVALAAFPQIFRVLHGLQDNDPFLTYRQAQSADLGIDLVSFILATLPIGLWVLALSLNLQGSSLSLPARTFVPAGLLALVLLSFNNVWGFVQEPYRMWIDSLMLATFMAVPLTAFVLTNTRQTRSRSFTRVASMTALAAIILSWWNVGGFRTFVNNLEPISFGSSRLDALGKLTEGRGGLLASDPCLDPAHLKVASRERVAFYSPGLAWPDDRDAIDAVIESRAAKILDPEILRKAGVTYLVTDSACDAGWEPAKDASFAAAGEVTYGSEDNQASLKLWLIQ